MGVQFVVDRISPQIASPAIRCKCGKFSLNAFQKFGKTDHPMCQTRIRARLFYVSDSDSGEIVLGFACILAARAENMHWPTIYFGARLGPDDHWTINRVSDLR